MDTATNKKGSGTNVGMIALLFASVIAASMNTVLFKITLNAFSSPTTNYGFFVSQFSTLLYFIQAAVVSCIIVWRDPAETKDLAVSKQSVFLSMGTFDSASSTLSAIAGAACPGALQTILNQMVIPITMGFGFYFLQSYFETYQISGSVLIFCGSCLASSDYFFASSSAHSNGTSVAVYFLSVIPSAMSNIYKEKKMKETDMNEVHTSTMVSFWQLLIGFMFLPLMALPQLGGLDAAAMKTQLSDGFTCFWDGYNPGDPTDEGCSDAALLFMVYVVVNFVYNVMMLSITKNGSAVLLVTSQALSLPLTNICFTMKPLMGDDAVPLTISDVAGLVLVCIGFVAYSGFGFATNFMVAQGTPGQMTYAAFEDHDEVVVSTKVATDPEELVGFMVGAMVEAHRLYEEALGGLPTPSSAALSVEGGGMLEMIESNSSSSSSQGATESSHLMNTPPSRVRSISASSQHGGDTPVRRRGRTRSGVQDKPPLSTLEASEAARDVLKQAVAILDNQIKMMKSGKNEFKLLASPVVVRRKRTPDEKSVNFSSPEGAGSGYEKGAGMASTYGSYTDDR